MAEGEGTVTNLKAKLEEALSRIRLLEGQADIFENQGTSSQNSARSEEEATSDQSQASSGLDARCEQEATSADQVSPEINPVVSLSTSSDHSQPAVITPCEHVAPTGQTVQPMNSVDVSTRDDQITSSGGMQLMQEQAAASTGQGINVTYPASVPTNSETAPFSEVNQSTSDSPCKQSTDLTDSGFVTMTPVGFLSVKRKASSSLDTLHQEETGSSDRLGQAVNPVSLHKKWKVSLEVAEDELALDVRSDEGAAAPPQFNRDMVAVSMQPQVRRLSSDSDSDKDKPTQGGQSEPSADSRIQLSQAASPVNLSTTDEMTTASVDQPTMDTIQVHIVTPEDNHSSRSNAVEENVGTHCHQSDTRTDRDMCYKAVLRENHMMLVNELNPMYFLHILSKFYRSFAEIRDISGERQQMREILETLKRFSFETFQCFCNCIAGLYPDTFETIMGRPPTMVEKCFWLKETLSEICKPNPDSFAIDEQFVKLRLIDNQNLVSELKEVNDMSPGKYRDHLVVSSSRNNIEISELLPTEPTSGVILLTGRAGIGKTTLLRYLNHQWANGQWAQEFCTAFVLNIRSLCSVSDMITLTQLLFNFSKCMSKVDRQISHDIFDKAASLWLSKNSDQVLILIDGLDEIADFGTRIEDTRHIYDPFLQANPIDWCINVLLGNQLQNATTIVASRPFLALSELKCCRMVEVLGLDKQSVEDFIDKNVITEKQDHVKQILLCNPFLVSVCSITFYCAILSKILAEDTTSSETFESLNTYSRITSFIIEKLDQRCAREYVRAGVALSTDLKSCLPKLAQLAYLGLVSNTGKGNNIAKLVFSKADFRAVNMSDPEIKAGVRSGILATRGSHTNDVLAEFLHLSIQELLAVIHVLLHGSSEAVKNIGDVIQLGQFSMARLFLYGVAFDSGHPSMTLLSSIFQSGEKSIMPPLPTGGNGGAQPPLGQKHQDVLKEGLRNMSETAGESASDHLKMISVQAAYESQSPEYAQLVASHLVDDEGFFTSSGVPNAVDMRAYLHVLGQHENLSDLNFWDVGGDDASMAEVETFLGKNTTVKKLMLALNKISEKGMDHLRSGLISNHSVEVFFFRSNNAPPGVLEQLSHTVERNDTLRDFMCGWSNKSPEEEVSLLNTLKENTKLIGVIIVDMSGQGVVHLSEVLKALVTTIKHLKLYSPKLSPGEVIILSHTVNTLINVKELLLTEVNIPDKAMEDLADMLQASTCRLVILNLRYCRMSDSGAQLFWEAIETNTSLRALTLTDTETRASRLRYVNKGLRINQSLTSLYLDSNNLGNEGARVVTDILRENKSLQLLDLQKNNITEVGFRVLEEAIMMNNVLRKLDLRDNPPEVVGAFQAPYWRGNGKMVLGSYL